AARSTRGSAHEPIWNDSTSDAQTVNDGGVPRPGRVKPIDAACAYSVKVGSVAGGSVSDRLAAPFASVGPTISGTKGAARPSSSVPSGPRFKVVVPVFWPMGRIVGAFAGAFATSKTSVEPAEPLPVTVRSEQFCAATGAAASTAARAKRRE